MEKAESIWQRIKKRIVWEKEKIEKERERRQQEEKRKTEEWVQQKIEEYYILLEARKRQLGMTEGKEEAKTQIIINEAVEEQEKKPPANAEGGER